MAMQARASGVLVEARGAAAVVPSALRIRRARRGELAPPAPPGKGKRRAAAAPAPPMTEEEAIVDAMEAQELELLDAIAVAAAAAPAAAASARRRATAPAAGIDLAVPLVEGESAVVLVDQGGVYEWKLPDREGEPAPAQRARRRAGPAQALVPGPARTAVFHIPLQPGPAAAPARRAARRAGLATKIGLGKAVVYVFRFIARPMVRGAVAFLERHVKHALVHVTAPDPAAWQVLADDAPLALPPGRPARVLLLVHGTFSSTAGSFGPLAGQAEGFTFLQTALGHYDLVIGWDHPTLSVLPTDNAIALAARLERIGFAEPPVVDAIGFSRGGLVLRSLVEHVLPSSPLKVVLRRAIFVGCTNGGTELANPENWHRLADRYTNLAAAGARAMSLLPGFASAGATLSAAIRGVGVLVKVLASSAITDAAVPGLAAMEPEGDFIRDLNGPQPGQPTPEQAYYCAITANFDPDRARGEADSEVLPPGLLLKLADKATDALYGKPNDLVVHVDSMTQIDEAVGSYIRERFDFGVTGIVHHCAYFGQPGTARHLSDWLQVGPSPAMRPPLLHPGAVPRLDVFRPWVKRLDGSGFAYMEQQGMEAFREAMRGAPRDGVDFSKGFAGGGGAGSGVDRRGGSARRHAAARTASRPPATKKAAKPLNAAVAVAASAAAAAAAAAEEQVACHFRAETDDEYVLEQVHAVDVTIAQEALKATRRGASRTASAKVTKRKPLIVECMPMLRVSLADPDYARIEIPVPPPGAPATLRFDLKANEAGAGQVKVQVRQGPLPLVTLTLDLQVVQQRSGTRRPATAMAGLAAFPQVLPRATDELRIIQLQPFGQKTQYRYELRLPSLRVQEAFESAVLDSDPAGYVASIHKRIEDRWADSGSEKETFARDLRAIGAELFDELFPLELKQLLWQHRQAIRSVQVLSSEPFIPWELVLLRDPAQRRAGPAAAFLGELGVVRWLVNGYPPESLRLRKGKARYVVPSYPPPDELPGAQGEIALLRQFGATEVPAQAAAVYRLLERPGQFDLLHIACHGATDAADIGAARLQMPGQPRADGSLSEEDVLATTVRQEAELRAGGSQPMVVLNACQSGRGGYTLKGVGGFAEAFIEAGAGLFVGSSWSIGDVPAYAFVHEFYAQFLQGGKPLAAAAAAARKKAREDGDATWLAYVVYGHPRAVVQRT